MEWQTLDLSDLPLTKPMTGLTVMEDQGTPRFKCEGEVLVIGGGSGNCSGSLGIEHSTRGCTWHMTQTL